MTAGVNHQDGVLSLVVDKGIASTVQEKLQAKGLVNKKFRPRIQENNVIIPLISKESVTALEWFDSNLHRIALTKLQINPARLNPGQELLQQITTMCDAQGLQLTDQMIECVPKKWELFGDLALSLIHISEPTRRM